MKTKKKGNYCVLQMNPDYKPRLVESKEVYGVTFEQERNEAKITTDLFKISRRRTRISRQRLSAI